MSSALPFLVVSSSMALIPRTLWGWDSPTPYKVWNDAPALLELQDLKPLLHRELGMCAWHGILSPASGLPQDWYMTSFLLCCQRSLVTSKRMRTGNISHSTLPMHYSALSCAAIYKTCRAEELTLYETRIAKRLNNFHLKFSWLWSLLLSCGYTTLTLGSLPK